MIEFENGTYNGIYYTRFIASWVRKGGMLKSGHDISLFRSWLKHLGLGSLDIDRVTFLATNGKMELEGDAKEFLEENK